MKDKTQSKSWLGVGKVGKYCDVSTATVRRWIKGGELQAIQLPSGHYRISLTEFREFLKRHDMPIAEELLEIENGRSSDK